MFSVCKAPQFESTVTLRCSLVLWHARTLVQGISLARMWQQSASRPSINEHGRSKAIVRIFQGVSGVLANCHLQASGPQVLVGSSRTPRLGIIYLDPSVGTRFVGDVDENGDTHIG